MSLLARAHASRLAHKPQPVSTSYAGPVDPRFGCLPGWVAEVTRKQSPDYAKGN
jgi:hypothetical protein